MRFLPNGTADKYLRSARKENSVKALTVYVNGAHVCTASLGDDGGFDGSQNHHVKWCFRHLKVGDEVRIVMEEASRIDEPHERKTVEEMDRWARSLRPEGKAKDESE